MASNAGQIYVYIIIDLGNKNANCGDYNSMPFEPRPRFVRSGTALALILLVIRSMLPRSRLTEA